MATVTLQVCDLCGDGETRAVETIQFDAGGAIEVDVCARHQGEWHELELRRAKFAEVGRRVGQQEKPKTQRQRDRSGERSATEERRENAAIREWARAQGIDISERGRIGGQLRDRYRRWRWEQDHPTESVDRAATLRPVPAPPTATRPVMPPAAAREHSIDEALAVHSEGSWPNR